MTADVATIFTTAPDAPVLARPAIDAKPWTPPEIAKHLGIKAEKVLTWIRAGELRAFNVATKQGGRPLWRVKLADLESFIAKRSTSPPRPKPARSRIPTDVIEFY